MSNHEMLRPDSWVLRRLASQTRSVTVADEEDIYGYLLQRKAARSGP